MGLVTKIVDPDNRITKKEYYLGGRLKKITYPDASFIKFTYDKNGNVIYREDNKGDRVECIYNNLDKMVGIKNNRGEERSFTYDCLGNLTSITDENHHTTKYEYTSMSKLANVTDPLGTCTLYEYDKMGAIIAVTKMSIDETMNEIQGLNRQKEIRLALYHRNLSGLVDSITDADGNKEFYKYDSYGRMVQKTDMEGIATEYQYDCMHNLQKVMYGDGKTVEMEYDALNRLTEVKDWLGLRTIQRNIEGYPEKIKDHKDRETLYEWEPYGKIKKMIYPDGQEISFSYNQNQKLEHMGYGTDDFVDFHYNEDGYLEDKLYLNGSSCKGKTSYLYNDRGFIETITHADKNGLLDRYRYKYDSRGNKIEIQKYRVDSKDENGTYSLKYDELNRLTRIQTGFDCVEEYGYDMFGNRSFKSIGGQRTNYTYNALNQLIKETGENKKEYEYDLRGNLIKVLLDDRIESTYQFNAMNKLESARKKDGQTYYYQYDGLQNRIGKRSSLDATRINFSQAIDTGFGADLQTEYVLDYTKSDHNLIMQEDEQNTQVFIWEPENNQIIGQLNNNHSFFYLNDELGSPNRMLNKHGGKEETFQYHAFGDSLDKRKTKHQVIGYTGYLLDLDINMYFAGERYYKPEHGRFISQDRIPGRTDYPLSLNPYTYCFNSPFYYLDPDGADPIWPPDRKEGTEAHKLLQAYYEEFYSFIVIGEFEYVGGTEVFIPSGIPWTDSGTGRADFVLTIEDMNLKEVYELKPVTHFNEKFHSTDKNQLDGYIKALRAQIKKDDTKKYTVIRGTTFDPDYLEIPSNDHPGWYIKYYADYGLGYMTVDGTGNPYYETYDGMIYWCYVKDEDHDDNLTWYPINWIGNLKDKKPPKDTKVIKFKDYKDQKDDIAAAVIIGGAIYLLVKLILALGTGQFWIVFC